MKKNALLFIALVAPLALWSAPKADSTYIHKLADGEIQPAAMPEKKGKTGWWARSWTTSDGAGFYGKPQRTRTENDDTTIVLRYTRYTTEYDVEFHSPIWGAYTLDETAVANDISGERPASNPDFARPGQFFQEPLVVAESKKEDVLAASHGTFTSTYDPRFPFLKVGGGVTEKQAKDSRVDRAIQRGHMVPNNAMKCQGTVEQGQAAQIESFSVANIVPQMAKSNAPSWSGLEDMCFNWASELKQVWLFVGPVYLDRAHPTFIKKLKDHAEQVTPSPEELFYIVIGKRNGKVSAIAFLMPHTPEITDFHGKQVPVRKIEELTGLNFMPELGQNDDVETRIDAAWLQTATRSGGVHEDER